MVLRRPALPLLLLILVLGISACGPETPTALVLPEMGQTTSTPTALPSPVPERVLSICLGEEPRSLFLYGDLSTSAQIIRQALNDDPVDQVDFQVEPVLLKEIPSQENGLVNRVVVEVFPGDKLVDAWGNITYLASGVEFRPAGCDSEDCWETYTQQTSVELDQVEIHYQINPGFLWSDGEPITLEDSLFSYQTADLIYGEVSPIQLRYTASYQLGEEDDLVWKGLPGYLGVYSYQDFFFPPLPRHRLENFTREEFLTAPQSNLQPVGWGAYQVLEWVAGDHISMIRNPNFHRAEEGLPAFDALVFRFVTGGEEALAAVRSGECQVAANVPDLLAYQSELIRDLEDGKLAIYTDEGSAWEQISFGIQSLGRRLTPLADQDLRLALAGCIDRESLSRARLDAGEVIDDYQIPGQAAADEVEVIPYQPAVSGLSLRDLGWVDQDGDPETPRVAEGVEGIPDGRTLEFTLLTSDIQAKSITLDYIQEGLEGCGVGVGIETLPASELLAPGPEGPVFGRNFDLAYFAWAAGNYQPCRLFITSEIPGLYPEYPKGWGGVNAGGYSNQDFDEACLVLSTNLPDSETALDSERQLIEIFRSEMPVLPLFFRQDLIIASPDLSGLDSGVFSPFWNIEALE
ncbi:MAG: ABC transporter substrate-binding protein [Anaerolineales bacterium]